MIKKLSILAALLLIIGIVGVLFTYNSEQHKTELLDEKVVETNHVQDIIIDADDADITILPTEEKQATITLFGSDTTHHLTAEVSGEILYIQSKNNQMKLFSFDFFPIKLALTVYLPQDAYEKVHASSGNGEITMQALSGVDVLLRSDNGKIQVNDVQSETILVETSNGRIEAKEIAANKVGAESNNGSIRLEEVDAEVMAETSNGKISLHTTYLNHPIEMHSDNGKIDIITDQKPDNVTYDLKTQNGKISVLDEKDWDVKVGKGDNVIKLTTANGNITITN